MKKLLQLLQLIQLLFLPSTSTAQVDSIFTSFHFDDNLIEKIDFFEIEDENDFFEEFAEIYDASEKININDLSTEVAFSILKMSDYQYYHLQKHIAENGFLISIYELASVEGFSIKYVQKIEPYILAAASNKERKHTFKSVFRRPKHKLLLRYSQVLEKKAGYDKNRNTHYVGTPQMYAFRYNFSTSEHITIGVAGKKNAGEEFFKSSQKQGFGFYSCHLQVKNIGILQSVIVGDYRLHFGQGLIVGNGFLSNVSGEIRKTSSALRPVTAMSQSNFMRGAALQLGNYKFCGVLFYGHRFFDGSIIEIESDIFAFEGAITNTGLHRTETELKKQDALFNRIYGAHFRAQFKSFRIGTQIIQNEFSLPILPTTRPYQYFDFSGKGLLNASFDYQALLIKQNILFGEIAASSTKGLSLLQGAIIRVDPRMKLSVLIRYFSKSFAAFDGKPYSKNNKFNNETGVLMTYDIILSKSVNMTALIDIYKFLWLRYLIDKPMPHFDASLRFDVSLSRNCVLLIRYNYKTQAKNIKENTFYNQISETEQQRLRIILSYSFLYFFYFKSEISGVFNRCKDSWEYKSQNSIKKNYLGLLAYQDFGTKIEKIGLDLIVRLAIFDTDTYDERLYAYENDLLYTFTISSYYYRGSKTYLILKWNYKWFEIQCKISRLLLDNKNQISSGLEFINKPHKSEFKVQTLLKF